MTAELLGTLLAGEGAALLCFAVFFQPVWLCPVWGMVSPATAIWGCFNSGGLEMAI